MSFKEVLDKGFVKIIDHVGDDSRVVFAARRSVQDNKKKNRPDAQLIDYLIRNEHMSPLEHCSVTFEIKAPIFVLRQLMRHRTGKYSELSLRYSSPEELDFYVPTKERVEDVGGAVIESDGSSVLYGLELTNKSTMGDYRSLQNGMGWPSELARINLPVSMYSNILFTIDLRNLLHFLKERMAVGAQWEIRQYGEAIYELVKPFFPIVIEAWERHHLCSLKLSSTETNLLIQVMEYMVTITDNDRDRRIFREKIDTFIYNRELLCRLNGTMKNG